MPNPPATAAPNRIPWPPLIYVTAAAIGLILGWVMPLPWFEFWPLRAAGFALFALAVLLDIRTMLAFRRHQTTIMPHRAATNLITSGPFAWSRNPIYVGNTMMLLGAGLAFEWPWLVILAPVAAFITQKLAIEREERHLAEKFGDAWTAYAAKVPRWVV